MALTLQTLHPGPGDDGGGAPVASPELPRCPEGQPLGLGKCPACVAERTRWDRAYDAREAEPFALHADDDGREPWEVIEADSQRMRGGRG